MCPQVAERGCGLNFYNTTPGICGPVWCSRAGGAASKPILILYTGLDAAEVAEAAAIAAERGLTAIHGSPEYVTRHCKGRHVVLVLPDGKPVDDAEAEYWALCGTCASHWVTTLPPLAPCDQWVTMSGDPHGKGGA